MALADTLLQLPAAIYLLCKSKRTTRGHGQLAAAGHQHVRRRGDLPGAGQRGGRRVRLVQRPEAVRGPDLLAGVVRGAGPAGFLLPGRRRRHLPSRPAGAVGVRRGRVHEASDQGAE